MSLKEIDILQSAQIATLESDVADLRDKLNLIVADITALTTKLNTAIGDADDLNGIINRGYSVASGGGSTDHGILKTMDLLWQALEDHIFKPTNSTTPSNGTYVETHPPDHLGGTILMTGGRPTTQVSRIDPTAQGNDNPRSTYTATAVASTIIPAYAPVPQNILTLKGVSEKRARKLARKIQGQITEEDRVNTNTD